uniref:Uncharacterized protein n=1 Tax=Arion vulgaris TaxID=1028688 RepID=A0A0B7BQ51_9EUPU
MEHCSRKVYLHKMGIRDCATCSCGTPKTWLARLSPSLLVKERKPKQKEQPFKVNCVGPGKKTQSYS